MGCTYSIYKEHLFTGYFNYESTPFSPTLSKQRGVNNNKVKQLILNVANSRLAMPIRNQRIRIRARLFQARSCFGRVFMTCMEAFGVSDYYVGAVTVL